MTTCTDTLRRVQSCPRNEYPRLRSPGFRHLGFLLQPFWFCGPTSFSLSIKNQNSSLLTPVIIRNRRENSRSNLHQCPIRDIPMAPIFSQWVIYISDIRQKNFTFNLEDNIYFCRPSKYCFYRLQNMFAPQKHAFLTLFHLHDFLVKHQVSGLVLANFRSSVMHFALTGISPSRC